VGHLPTIQADPLQMRQLLQNLIANGLKFHRPDEPPVVKVEGRFVHGRQHRAAGPLVEGESSRRSSEALRENQRLESPSTASLSEQCKIVVTDNGIGFEQQHQERIFGVFQRLHPRDVFEGVGIGLALCRKIVERHGGRITAHGAPGRGASFEIVLPVVQVPSPGKAATSGRGCEEN
jgi:signal transduction histidine kinase